MGKPHSLSHRRGLRGGSDSSAQTKPGRGICRLTLVSRSCSTVRLQAGASLWREGNTAARAHIPLPPRTAPQPHRTRRQGLPLSLPPQKAHPVPLRPSTLGAGPPALTTSLHGLLLPSPLPAPLGTFAQARRSSEEGGGVWREMGPCAQWDVSPLSFSGWDRGLPGDLLRSWRRQFFQLERWGGQIHKLTELGRHGWNSGRAHGIVRLREKSSVCVRVCVCALHT